MKQTTDHIAGVQYLHFFIDDGVLV